ncbi:MAG: hypothetical protein AMJ65_03820 [Phycisphaerae bacterium SG8_4]|nr:MAG: hypothetical protein AMJ65_03820 [Phycisphaerae bacterium SG8_4]
MLLLIGGCQSDKSGMTDAELERIALTQRIELEQAKGGLVLVVGGETLTSDEIIASSVEHFKPLAQASELERFKSQARGQLEELVMAKISNILLYQHAKKQAGGNIDEALEKAAETEYRKFILEFGGDEVKAEEKLKQSPGAMDKKSFMETQKRSMLIQSYLGTKSSAGRPITYRELIECYNDMKGEYFSIEAEITFRLIDIQPGRFQVTDPNQDRNELASNLAERLIIRLRSGEDFGELAKQYSHGHRQAFGGLWPSVHPESLAAPYNLIAAAVERIEPGQIAGPVVTQGHVFIIKLEAKQSAGYEQFENVQEQVERKIVLDRRNEVFDQLNAKLKAEAKVERTDEFVDFCLEKIYQMGRQQP